MCTAPCISRARFAARSSPDLARRGELVCATSEASSLPLLVLPAASGKVRRAVDLRVIGIRGINADHAPLQVAGAEECCGRRREFADCPTALHPCKHCGDENVSEIRSGDQGPRVYDGAMHAANDVPARCGRGFERIEGGTSTDHALKIQRASIACPSSVRRSAILYEVTPHGQDRRAMRRSASVRVMSFVRGQLVEEVAARSVGVIDAES